MKILSFRRALVYSMLLLVLVLVFVADNFKAEEVTKPVG